jgi:DNA polymerase-3 subunit beta
MEFVVKKSDILRELAAVQPAAEHKTTIPILTNVLLKTENGSLHIAATDLDCSLRTTCPAAGNAGSAGKFDAAMPIIFVLLRPALMFTQLFSAREKNTSPSGSSLM